MRIESTKLLRLGAKKPKFRKEKFTELDAEASLKSFKEKGRVYYKRFGLFKKDLTPEEASDRITGSYYDKADEIFVQLEDGSVHEIESRDELQRLDTFHGLGHKPVEGPEVVDALKTFDKGIDSDDGLFRPGYASLTGEKDLSAFDAHRVLTTTGDRAGRAALNGAGFGAIMTGVLAAAAWGAGQAFPQIIPPELAKVSSETILKAGGAALATGVLAGAGVNYVKYKTQNPKKLEVRHGQDAGLHIQNLDHATEVHQWLKDRAENPFTIEQQKQALDHLSSEVGLYSGWSKIDPDKAHFRLREGDSVFVPSAIHGHRDELSSVRHLQQLDTVRGLGINPVLPEEVSKSLKFLEVGRTAFDGLYENGSFHKSDRLSAFEAVDYLFREREPIGAKVKGKNYQTKTLKNIQELNALKGDGRNTILPEGPFEALKYFDQKELMKTEIVEQDQEAKPLDSYEALQEMNEKRAVRVPSRERDARAVKPADLHELQSLEFDKKNSILPQRDFDLLNHWEQNGGYQIKGETADQHAYEALQQVQAKTEFEIQSAGRYAPALTFQDMEDLASFEAPDAGFPNSVPPMDQDRLEYFQGVNEEAGLSPTRVGSRKGRAYEGYRELRDGNPFDVQSAGVWNSVTSPQALHDLDALLGRQVNDILPQDQYDLLKELGDGQAHEGLATNGKKLNSYGALQEFRQGYGITYDFHGGDFGELLQIETPVIEALDETKELRDNQKEYDKYAYTVPEWKNKTERKLTFTPDLAKDNLKHGESNLAAGERKLARGQSDLSDAERRLSRAKSDLRDAEWDLSRARSMPRYITKYRRVCDSDGTNCRDEAYQEYNWTRHWAISRAEADISDAKRRIRRAESDIDDAERLIRQARADIRRAENQIADAKQLKAMLPDLKKTVGRVSEDNYSSLVRDIDATIERMKTLSHISTLDRNLRHQGQLIDNMETRPKRPEGWQIPHPLVQS